MSAVHLMDFSVDHIKKNHRNEGKKRVAHISSQLVSNSQESLSWLFDHKFIAYGAGAWDTISPFCPVSVRQREGSLNKYYGTVRTSHAEVESESFKNALPLLDC